MTNTRLYEEIKKLAKEIELLKNEVKNIWVNPLYKGMK